MFHASEEQYAQARPALQKAADLDCGDADARYYIGLVDAACGDVPAALRAFQRALELRPADLMIAYHLAIAGRAARELGLDVVLRLPENRPSVSADSRSGSLASHIAVEPEFIEAFLDLPPTEMDGELFELLCGAVKMALGSHPAYADLHYHCARLLDRLGKAQEAIAHLERALAINGRYVKARIEMARRQAQAGMTTQALAHLEAAIECGADWPDVHCLAGEILCRLGELPRGRLHLERAMQLNGSYRRAADSLRLLAA
jgi:tetratricopeptide (TPR) repeat protein